MVFYRTARQDATVPHLSSSPAWLAKTMDTHTHTCDLHTDTDTYRQTQTDRQTISKTYNPECFRCQSGKLKTRSKSFICKSFLDQNSAIVEPLSSPTGTTSTLCHALNTRPGLAPSNARAARVWDLTFVVLAGPGVQVVVHVFVHNPNTAQRELITRTQLRV